MSRIDELKTSLRALERKADKLSIEIARRLDLPRVWSYEMIDVDDPVIADVYQQRKQVMKQYNEIYWEIAKLEHDMDNPRMDYYARRRVSDFLSSFDDDNDCLAFLMSIHMTTHELIEKESKDPGFLERVRV